MNLKSLKFAIKIWIRRLKELPRILKEIDRPLYLYQFLQPKSRFDFQANEKLYIRVDPSVSGKENWTRKIPSPINKSSANRSTYSTPSDILFRHNVEQRRDKNHKHSIIAIKISSIPKKIEQLKSVAGSKSYTVKTVHDPIWNNYSHSELRLFDEKTDKPLPKAKPSDEQRKIFREKFSDYIETDPKS